MKHGLIKVAAAIPAYKVQPYRNRKADCYCRRSGCRDYRFPRAFNNGLHLSGPFPAATSS